MRSRISPVLVPAVMASWFLGATAVAVPVTPISLVVLEGGGDRTWDANNASGGCLTQDLYAPVGDGAIGVNGDAFDGGLVMIVDGKGFVDGDDTGNHVGEQLTVGPLAVHGVNVLRQDRAIGKFLRSLIRFTNTRGSAQVLNVYFDSDLGSDGLGAIRDTSSGDVQVTSADRWFITSDAAGTPDDPVITFVSHGRGSIASPGDTPLFAAGGTDCMLTHWRIRVPAHRVRYLLTFTELNPSNVSAVNGSGKYNDRNLNATMLDGIGATARARVVNWDLT
jgi:hypothetical protein